MIPLTKPNAVGLLCRTHSHMSQVNPAAAPDTVVVMKAFIAMPFMLSALPALKPNQPNSHKR